MSKLLVLAENRNRYSGPQAKIDLATDLKNHAFAICKPVLHRQYVSDYG